MNSIHEPPPISSAPGVAFQLSNASSRCPQAATQRARPRLQPSWVLVAGLALGIAAASACDKGSPQPPDGAVACTEEAKVCPDGSAVGRQGPKCEFAPCPEPGSDSGGATACTKDAKVCPDGTSVGRTGPDCEFSPCPGA